MALSVVEEPEEVQHSGAVLKGCGLVGASRTD
jgi:hypothetical protein